MAVIKLMLTQNTASIRPTLGTKFSVISCTEVRACKRPMITPTTSATPSSGAAMRSAIHSACRVRSTIRFSSMARSSDRHPQDFLIGLDHLVAHGDHGLERDFGLGDTLHQIMRLGLAGHGAGGGGINLIHHPGKH